MAAAVLLALFYGFLLASIADKSLTMDEPGHVAAGYFYWKLNDYRFDPENGNLPQRWAALPALLERQEFSPTDVTPDFRNNASVLGYSWFSRSGVDASRRIFFGRAACALLAVALGFVVWRWARQLFGPTAGMVSLLLYVLNPAILANGPLMTSDLAAALFFLLSLWRISATLEAITWGNVLGSALAVAALFLSKMSAVLVLPVALLLVILRVSSGRPLPLGKTQVLVARGRQVLAFAAVAMVHAVAAVLLAWICFGFRFSAFSPTAPEPARFGTTWAQALGEPGYEHLLEQLHLDAAQTQAAHAVLAEHGVTAPDWSVAAIAAMEDIRVRVLTAPQAVLLQQLQAAPPPALIPRMIAWARDHRLLPEAYLYGWAVVWQSTQSDRTFAFLNGEVNTTGWASFFPYVFAVKTPLAVFAVVLLALLAWRDLARVPSPAAEKSARALPASRTIAVLSLGIFLAGYAILALRSHINIGHRHLLPLYPGLFILCGAAATVLARPARIALAVLLAVLAVETLAWFPNYLAYVNGLIPPAQAYRHIVDSSLDWGQELPAIARYLRAHGGPAYLAYFGIDSPTRRGINARLIGGAPGFEWRNALLRFVPEKNVPLVPQFLAKNPDFDPGSTFQVQSGDQVGLLLVQRPTALRLRGGTYVISATALQPLYHAAALAWSDVHEKAYQQLRARVQPWLNDDPAAKQSALAGLTLDQWNELFNTYREFRFARLTAYLRKREPDDEINHSVLVYRLSDADVAQALDGPAP